MDRGIPTKKDLEAMRQSDPPVQYLVGTPKGSLKKLEKKLLELPWQAVRQGVEVKLFETRTRTVCARPEPGPTEKRNGPSGAGN